MTEGGRRRRNRVTRRRFLSAAAMLAGGMVSRAAETPAVAAQAPGLPAPVARLTSMAGLVTPITADERRVRIERARALMTEQRVDAVLVTQSPSVDYFAGIAALGTRRVALVIPRAGRPFAVCGPGDLAEIQLPLQHSPLDPADVLVAPRGGVLSMILAGNLKARGLASARVAVDAAIGPDLLAGMAAIAPAQQLAGAAAIVDACRLIKDAHEVDLLHLAARATRRCYDAVVGAVQPGVTQLEIGQWTAAAFARVGFPGMTNVRVGASTAQPHGSLSTEIVRERDLVTIEGGCPVHGYKSALARTWAIGERSDEITGLFASAGRAQRAALACARSGAPFANIFSGARSGVGRGGLSPGGSFRYVAHGIGMDGYESPCLSQEPAWTTLASGMVLTGGTNLTHRGRLGVRLSDMFHVTDAGAEILTS